MNGPASGAEEDVEEISIIRFGSILLRHRHKVLFVPLGAAALAIALALIFPPTYTSSAAFRPEAGRTQVSQLSGLASQFGVDIPTGLESGQSPQFYAELLETRELLSAAVQTEYSFRTGDSGEVRSGDLVEIFEMDGDTPEQRVANMIEELREQLAVSTNGETGMIRVSMETRWASLSQQIVDRVIELVNKFNLETRRSRASAEREFLDERLARARSELRAAEDSLQRFLESNRNYQNSPQLRFAHDRLERRVSLRQQLVTSLAQSYEQARIEEVRTTPVITVVDPAERPAKPDPRQLLVRAFLGLLFGAGVAAAWIVGSELMVTARAHEPDDYAEFERLKEETREEVAGVGARLRRWIPFPRSR